jgi:hypothetical protein
LDDCPLVASRHMVPYLYRTYHVSAGHREYQPCASNAVVIRTVDAAGVIIDDHWWTVAGCLQRGLRVGRSPKPCSSRKRPAVWLAHPAASTGASGTGRGAIRQQLTSTRVRPEFVAREGHLAICFDARRGLEPLRAIR